jgi:SMODS-associating 2TM, beta-strand rich effector domain
MFSTLQAWTIVGIASVIWLALSVVGTVNGGPASILVLSDLIPLLLIGASLFERWGWRWPRLHPHFVGQPVVSGTWRGDLESFWENEAGERPPVKTVYLTIAQTLTTVFVRLLTDESASDQMAGSVKKAASGNWVVSYTYTNTPKLGLRKGSPLHMGGALLTILGEPPTRIEGEYWTDRDSKGTLTMAARVPAIAPAFTDAQALFAETAPPI